MRGFQARYGPWAVVTGASQGLGAAYAGRLAALGRHPAVIPGRDNRLAGLVMRRLLPRRTAIALMARVPRGMYGEET